MVLRVVSECLQPGEWAFSVLLFLHGQASVCFSRPGDQRLRAEFQLITGLKGKACFVELSKYDPQKCDFTK